LARQHLIPLMPVIVAVAVPLAVSVAVAVTMPVPIALAVPLAVPVPLAMVVAAKAVTVAVPDHPHPTTPIQSISLMVRARRPPQQPSQRIGKEERVAPHTAGRRDPRGRRRRRGRAHVGRDLGARAGRLDLGLERGGLVAVMVVVLLLGREALQRGEVQRGRGCGAGERGVLWGLLLLVVVVVVMLIRRRELIGVWVETGLLALHLGNEPVCFAEAGVEVYAVG
jgi:hypothetical protein